MPSIQGCSSWGMRARVAAARWFFKEDFGKVTSTDHHYHLALSSTIKLAEKNSLPATEQQFSFAEGNSDGRTYQRCLDVRIGILFSVTKAHAMLRYQSTQKVKHIAWHVRVSIFCTSSVNSTNSSRSRERTFKVCNIFRMSC